MPVQKTTSPLAKKLNKIGEAHAKVHDKPPEVGNAGLPSGIGENGVAIAKLIACGFGIYKKGKLLGEPYFMAEGVVIEPKEHNGMPIAGLRTKIGPIPLCDTPEYKSKKSFLDHWDDTVNTLKLLAGEEQYHASVPADPPQAVQDGVEALAAGLVEAGVYFRFRTWGGGPYIGSDGKERVGSVNHEWNGACDYTPGNDPGAGVDETPPDAEPQGEPGDAPPDTDATVATEAGDAPDIAALVAAADKDPTGKTKAGQDAGLELTRLALAAGKTQEDVDNSKSWAEVGEWIAGGDAEPEPDAEAEPEPEPEAAEPEPPAKGGVYKHHPRSAKDGKPLGSFKKEDYEVLTVNQKAKTVTLKNSKSGKTLSAKDGKAIAVKWEHLEA